MKAQKAKRKSRTKWNLFRWFLQPRNCLPCVGLVVLGGCLTFIVMPDEPAKLGSVFQPKEIHSGLEDAGFPTIIIDPGHGGKDEGTKWHGVSEKDLALDIGLRVERLLKSAGFSVVMTRRDNVFISLEERTRIANQYANGLFVSIHFNSDPSGSASGVETYYARQKEPPDSEWSWIGLFAHAAPPATDYSVDLAASIETAVTARTAATNRGVRQANFYVIHHTRCPAVLVEGGYVSNVFEAQMLVNEGYRERIAQGIVEGMFGYFKAHPPERPQPGLQMARKTG